MKTRISMLTLVVLVSLASVAMADESLVLHIEGDVMRANDGGDDEPADEPEEEAPDADEPEDKADDGAQTKCTDDIDCDADAVCKEGQCVSQDGKSKKKGKKAEEAKDASEPDADEPEDKADDGAQTKCTDDIDCDADAVCKEGQCVSQDGKSKKKGKKAEEAKDASEPDADEPAEEPADEPTEEDPDAD